MPGPARGSGICRYRVGKSAPTMTNVTAAGYRVPPTETYRRGGRAGGPHSARTTPPAVTRPPAYASGRTTALIGMEPAPAMVTLRPGRGAWTIAPSPTYIPTWLASSK